jgi:NAD(P)-dependent dehydrogenase (short-subunit alcohol dehydrogenase family)
MNPAAPTSSPTRLPKMEFDDKLIVITGGAGGIARATAKMLLAEGVRLLLIDPDASALEALTQEFEAGPRVRTVVSSLATPQACASALESQDRRIYALVHLAGIFRPDALDAASRPLWDATMAANLTNAFDMAAAVKAKLDPEATCRIVLVSSLAFRRGSFDHIAYSAAKGGIVGLVRALARALAPKVLVNGLAPGIIRTGMPEHMLEVPERRKRLLAETTLKRFGEAREVATVIRFLLSEDSSFITGQVINVDGGVVYG